MRRRKRTKWILGLAAAAALGVLYQTACMSMAGEEFLRTVDFCFLFDCQNGAFGGLIDPCSGATTTSTSSSSTSTNTVVTTGNLFVDCPPATTTP